MTHPSTHAAPNQPPPNQLRSRIDGPICGEGPSITDPSRAPLPRGHHVTGSRRWASRTIDSEGETLALGAGLQKPVIDLQGTVLSGRVSSWVTGEGAGLRGAGPQLRTSSRAFLGDSTGFVCSDAWCFLETN